MFQITINGSNHDAREGATILDALRAAHIDLPTLCHDPRLEPYGGCRLCVVHVHGALRPVTACNTTVHAGMVIETHPPHIEQLRRTLLHLMAERYPPDAVTQFPEKEFHRALRAYGVDATLARSDAERLDGSHTYIHVDMNRCIDCYRCVRICEDLQGQFVWQLWNRGDATRIKPDGHSFASSTCVSCGACVDTCPTGALEDKARIAYNSAENWTRTTCPYCGTGCELEAGTRAGQLVAARPVLDAPVSKGHLCVKGRYAIDYVHAADRITEPMIRDGDAWRHVSWDEVIIYTARRLQEIIARDGADAIGVLGSARATNEENYLAQKFARVVLGTHNIDCCARVCHTPTAAAMKLMLGAGAATNSYDDIEHATCILVCGANPTENHPIIGARVKQAVRKGAKLIVIDPRRIELARHADVHLALRPGTNVPLLNAMAQVIVEEQLYDSAFQVTRIAEWDEFRRFITAWTPEHAAEICGVSADLIRTAARLYATSSPAYCMHGLGLTEHVQGTEGVMCLVNLALLTGNMGKPGAGVNPLRGQNNVQGAAHMGCDPGTLTGGAALHTQRSAFEQHWGVTLPERPGLHLLQMMDAARAGKLKALYAIGYDVYLTNADAHASELALQNLEFVVVQDLFMNETARRYGSVFLPACSSFEKDGTFMNAERRIQRVRKVLAPLGASKTDAEIVCLLARALGQGAHFNFDRAESIWDEVRMVWPGARGISYARLEQGGLQWPCPDESHPGTAILHTETFPAGTRAALRRIDYRPTPETLTKEFPWLLVTGRQLYQFNAGTMTARTPNKLLRPTDTLDLCAEDARRMQLADGQVVRVTSRYGSITLPVRISDDITPGQCFTTFHDPDRFVNRVTSPHRDHYVTTPEYKVTAVHLAPQ